MKEEWLFPNAFVPVDVETTAALVGEIKRLIDVVGGMALAQRTWVGLTDDDLLQIRETVQVVEGRSLLQSLTKAIEQALKEKNT